ncbi:hypothetical protein RJ639_028414 [Escallonia herrerae]|uniref:THH1/TOM1/TOM3 domain-containing protein n=1 Tax=Escallonia herrerae TaxID=1293975 RepID=A0AA88X662_9ASTE|nr:hypothetical protein RJ639_028414 [Escallonia herrerae]
MSFISYYIMDAFPPLGGNVGFQKITNLLNFSLLKLVEILPSSLVLFILRKLPPKRGITQYHPIR